MRMSPQEMAQKFKELQSYISKIQDPVLKKTIWNEYMNKAREEWGYNPYGKPVKEKKEFTVEDLNKEEREIYDKIKMCEEYMFFEKDKKVEKEAIKRMKMMILNNESFYDIPESLRTSDILNLWLCAMNEILDELDSEFDEIIKKKDR